MSHPAPDQFASLAPGVAPPVPDPILAPPPAAAPLPPAQPLPPTSMPQLPVDPVAALDATVPLGPPAALPASIEATSEHALATTDPAARSTFDLGTALVIAITALTWQFLSHYARHQLPSLETSGAELSNFDTAVGTLPFAGTAAGPVLGALLAIGALAIVVRNHRSGEREPVLQGVVAALSVGAIASSVLLGSLVG